jgi:mono/diheme cytochrome c family protein
VAGDVLQTRRRPPPDPGQSAEWNRGAHLVRGLAHCDACHAPRGRLGANDPTPEPKGGLIPQLHWFAPGLAPSRGGAAKAEPRAQRVALLKTGRSTHASASGPMPEVVFKSTQRLADADLQAIALFLAELPVLASPAPRSSAVDPPAPSTFEAGRALYKDRCTPCHGEAGEGTPGAYPPLAGNSTVRMDPPANLVRMILESGFPPATRGNPRPTACRPSHRACRTPRSPRS